MITIGYIPTGTANDMIVYDDGRLFVGETPVGLSIWDVYSHSSPLGFTSTPGTAVGLAFDYMDSAVYIADWDEGIQLINTTDPTSPSIIATSDPGTDLVYGIERSFGMLLVSAGESGFYVYSVAELGREPPDSGYYTPDGANIVDVDKCDTLAIAADANGKLWFFDISEFIAGIDEAFLPREIDIRVYPNPFNSIVKITVDCMGSINRIPTIEIFDISGRMVAEIPVGAQRAALADNGTGRACSTPTIREYIWRPDKSVDSGVYLVRVNNTNSTTKIIYLK